MRNLPSSLREKLLLAIQAESTKAAPSVNLWISRPTVTLQGPDFLERQLVGSYASVSGISIAECHPLLGRDSTYNYIAFISNGTARIVRSAVAEVMSEHTWIDIGFSVAATSVAVAFDGKMPKDTQGKVEFVTEKIPWVFWTDSGGVLYGQKLGDNTPVVLAMQNATDVAAVRGMWSEVGDFDFGLIVFFLLAGDIYYRQYIEGTWTDAELVSFGPDVTYTKIAASRTWDYRIALQALAEDGTLYELFTQFAGIGKQNVEHIELADIKATADLVKVDYHDAAEAEHVEITSVDAVGALIYGLTSVPVSISNIDDGGSNWGLYIQIVFDHPIQDISGNQARFMLTDGNHVTYTATALSLSGDGLTLTLTMPDFNFAAYGLACMLAYTPGTVQCAATALEAFSFAFEPTNLVAPAIDPPETEAVWNE